MPLEVSGLQGTKLIIVTLSARSWRTVAALLHKMALHEAPTFSRYHHVLNVSRRLLPVLVRTLVAVGGELPSSSRPRDKGERAGEVVQAFVKR
jgi:hypothetical protein